MGDDDSASGRKTRPGGETETPIAAPEPTEQCDWCGSADLVWRNCKLLCRTCSAIVKSCADL